MSDSDTSRETRPSLLLRLRDARDDEAWNRFVEVYAPLVYGYMRGKGLQDADAADVSQAVLLEVMRSIRTLEYRPERGRFRGWLGTLAARGLGRFLAAKNRERNAINGAALAGDDAAQAPVDTGWDDEFHIRILQVALEQVQPQVEPGTWRAFECVWLEGKSATQTARELGIAIENVYVAKSRVLRRLEEQVLYLGEDLPQLVPLGRADRT